METEILIKEIKKNISIKKIAKNKAAPNATSAPKVRQKNKPK